MIDRAKYLSRDELHQLRDHALVNGSPTDWLLIDLATQTGLRVAEMASLFPKDFDRARQSLTVYRVKKKTKPVPETLPITHTLTRHIADYLRTYGDFWHGQRGKLTRRGLQQLWHRVCIDAGLSPKISIHAARHTLAVDLLRSTKNLRLVQKQLGHASPEVTANLYADIPWDDHQEELNKLYPAPPTTPRP
jgi:integrase